MLAGRCARSLEDAFLCAVRCRSLQLPLQMRRKPKAKCYRRVGRVGLARGGKYRGAGDEEIAEVEYPAIGVDHPVAAIGGHARRSDLMEAVECIRDHRSGPLFGGVSIDQLG